jgi:hypothetical protein
MTTVDGNFSLRVRGWNTFPTVLAPGTSAVEA